MHIIDLCAQVDLALSDEQTTGHPVDVRVLQVVGGQRPVGSPADEEDHLLTATNLVDNGCG